MITSLVKLYDSVSPSRGANLLKRLDGATYFSDGAARSNSNI